MNVLKDVKKGMIDSFYIEYEFVETIFSDKKLKKIFLNLFLTNSCVCYIPCVILIKIIPFFFENILNLNIYFLIVNLFWYFPIYLMTQISNLHFYSKLINYFFKKQNINISYNIKYLSQIIFYQLCFFTINIFINFIFFFPYFGNIIYIFSLSFFYSFYCYDYISNIYNIEYNQKIDFFESNWAYFLGNSLPFVMILYFFNYYNSFLLISMLFPIMISNCFFKKRILKSSYFKIPFFSFPKYLVDLFLKEMYHKYIN